jgi:hypothetical protein
MGIGIVSSRKATVTSPSYRYNEEEPSVKTSRKIRPASRDRFFT